MRGIALRLAEADADAFTAVTGARTRLGPGARIPAQGRMTRFPAPTGQIAARQVLCGRARRKLGAAYPKRAIET
jgi:hypothetical protein